MSALYIVTPSYNAAEYIEETIISVVTQLGDFEIYYHIQDGGSTDETIQIIKKWETILASPSPWIRCRGIHFSWKSEADNGMYDAINKGFYALQVPDDGIMAWINSDDIYFQYAFSTTSKAFQDVSEMQWFGGAIDVLLSDQLIIPAGDYEQPYPAGVIREGCCDDSNWRVLQQNGMFWKKNLWDKVGGLNAALRYAGDFALWIKFVEHTPFVHFPLHVGTFRRRKGQLSQHKGYQEEMEKICPWEKRAAAMKAALRKWRPLNAPVLKINKQGNFFISQEKVWPPELKKKGYHLYLPKLSMAIRLWIPPLHRLVRTLRETTRKLRKKEQ